MVYITNVMFANTEAILVDDASCTPFIAQSNHKIQNSGLDRVHGSCSKSLVGSFHVAQPFALQFIRFFSDRSF